MVWLPADPPGPPPRAAPDPAGEAPPRRDPFPDRAAPAGAREIVGVLSFRQQRKPQALAGQQMRQRHVGSAPRRLLSGLVAVETKYRLVRHLPQQRELV